MATEKTKLREVTIDYSDCSLGVQKSMAEVLYHRFSSDGSAIILLKTMPNDIKDIDQLLIEDCISKQKNCILDGISRISSPLEIKVRDRLKAKKNMFGPSTGHGYKENFTKGWCYPVMALVWDEVHIRKNDGGIGVFSNVHSSDSYWGNWFDLVERP